MMPCKALFTDDGRLDGCKGPTLGRVSALHATVIGASGARVGACMGAAASSVEGDKVCGGGALLELRAAVRRSTSLLCKASTSTKVVARKSLHTSTARVAAAGRIQLPSSYVRIGWR